MEVHQHTHTPRKKWTHYFWEFLMLFLAVFCGFFAEYQLEHKIEKERGKQYIKSFVEDLKTDTSIFPGLIQQYEEKNVVLSTITECYTTLIKNPASDSCILKLFLASSFFPDLVNTDRTLQQLKNAGGLRLIPREDADSIIKYDELIRTYQKIETTSFQEIQSAIRNSIYSLNNFAIVKIIATGPPPGTQVQTPIHHPILFSSGKESLNRYFNQLFFYYTGTLGNVAELKNIQKRAKGLIEFFNRKYGLK